MSDAELQRLIQDWYRGSADAQHSLAPTEDCPSITQLWRLVTIGEPPAEHQGHVETCDRCRRLCEVIEREHAAHGVAVPPVSRSRRLVYTLSGALALAACLALVVVNWPQQSLDADVALFCQWTYQNGDPTTMRGRDARQPDGATPELPDWLQQALNDPDVRAALEDQNRFTVRIVQHIMAGRLIVDGNKHLVIGSVVTSAATRDRLVALIERERAANDKIVDVLIRRVPGASQHDRQALRMAVERYREKHSFGRSN